MSTIAIAFCGNRWDDVSNSMNIKMDTISKEPDFFNNPRPLVI
jgi:hypothetical protein